MHNKYSITFVQTDIEVALLLNFGTEPQFKRVVFDNAKKSGKTSGTQGSNTKQ